MLNLGLTVSGGFKWPPPYRPDASKNIWKFCTKMRYFCIQFSKIFLGGGILRPPLPFCPLFPVSGSATANS